MGEVAPARADTEVPAAKPAICGARAAPALELAGLAAAAVLVLEGARRGAVVLAGVWELVEQVQGRAVRELPARANWGRLELRELAGNRVRQGNG